jgi:hypothetical protein
MEIIRDNKPNNLRSLADAHFNNLNPKKLDNTYHKYSLVERIRDRKIIDAAAGNLQHVAFWDFLLNNNEEKLKALLVSRPAGLKTLISEIDGIFTTALFSNQISYTDSALTPFGNIVKDVFNYTEYRKKRYCIEYFATFGLDFCPYCNMTDVYIAEITAGMGQQAEETAFHQLDHFYPQSRHPYLSLSFFNLVPSINYCNVQCKGEIGFDIDTHFNPFEKSLDDFFQFALTSAVIMKPSDVRLRVTNKKPYVPNAINDFQIISRYEIASVQKEIFNGYSAIRKRSPKTRKSLVKQFQSLFLNEQVILSDLLNAHSVPETHQDINRNRLGKLKRDICVELGVI